jgi:iron complex outermembrane receptor protein
VYSQKESNRFARLSVVYNFGNKKLNIKDAILETKKRRKEPGIN